MDFFITHITEKANKNVQNILKSTFISAGKEADKFEEALREKIGLINPVTLNSGTSALQLALDLAGIKEGDEVIIPPQTFVATGLVVLMQKAKPVFADIQIDTGNISPDSVKEKITSKTKAIIPVHYGGYPCDMDEINNIGEEYNLTVIEDAAHAFGASYKSKPVGSISRFTAFSFQAIKMLTTGDGGALCCLNESDYKRCKAKRWFGIDRENSLPSILGERVYDISEIGYKYHMNDIAAAVGLGNLVDIKTVINKHKKNATKYFRELKNVSGINLLNYNDDRESTYWLFTMLVERREDFIRALKSRDIPASVVHLRIDKNSIFGKMDKSLENMNVFNEKQVAIPVHSKLSSDDLEKIIQSIKMGW